MGKTIFAVILAIAAACTTGRATGWSSADVRHARMATPASAIDATATAIATERGQARDLAMPLASR